MKKISTLLLLLGLLTSSILQAQTKKVITGKVLNTENNTPLEGVTVTKLGTKGKAIKTVTDVQGNFKIEANANDVLGFTYVGYSPVQVILNSNMKELSVSMEIDAKIADEVVVIGYGTQKKSSLTGAVAKYKNERLDETPLPRLDQALQGKMAGVQVQNISSEAGAEPKINIRGISSVNAGSSPLVVVDGQPIPDGLGFINMADVESVEVLKDAASAAIYGSRGGSGVILVTTKSGKSEKVKYNFKYSLGRKTDYERYNILSSTEYATMLFDEAKLRYADSTAYTVGFSTAQRTAFGTNKGNLITTAERAEYLIEQSLFGGNGTDWQSESLRPGLFQNAQLNASGGTKTMKYFISGGYQRDEGMMYKSDFERFTTRAKLDMQFSKRVRLSVNINPSYTRRQAPSENFTNFYRFPSAIPLYHTATSAAFVNTLPLWANIKAGDFAQARHFNGLFYSGTMPDGSVWTPTTTTDPFGTTQNTPKSSVQSQDINSEEYRLQSSADFNFNILPGLDFKSQASFFINNTSGLNYANRNATADGIVSRGVYTGATTIDLLTENTLTYKKIFKKNSINILAGYTAQKTTLNRNQTTGVDYPNDDIRTLNNATLIDRLGTFGTKFQTGIISYLGRINYDYDNKYLISASFRTDGSSYFSSGNKWGSFPAISVGWVPTQEKFLRDVKWLNRLKFRGSYGATGNNRISDFAYLDLLNVGNYAFGAGNGVLNTGLVSSTTNIGKNDITWERGFQTNFGIDISILKNRISISFDAYQSKTEKLLLQQSAQAITGVQQSFNNIGRLKNVGIEFELSTVNIANKNFKWTTSANLSRNRNEILELGAEAFLLNQGERGEVYQNKIGNPLVQFLGFKTDGVWLSQDQINTERAKGLSSNLSNIFVPGGLKLVDTNGDNVIDNNDRIIIGNPYPKFTWGITNTFSYRAFDASFTVQGVQGGQVINGDLAYNETRRKTTVYIKNRWISPNNPGDGQTPFSTIGYPSTLTDFAVEDASYFALRELNIGYTLPSKVAKFVKLSSLRVYFAGQNLFFNAASSFRPINSEGRANSGVYTSTLLEGYQRGSFPIQKTYVFGIDINF